MISWSALQNIRLNEKTFSYVSNLQLENMNPFQSKRNISRGAIKKVRRLYAKAVVPTSAREPHSGEGEIG